ncbi:DUF11 domain-containing protein [Nocardia yamanashiensis]|uniref:DUF11 domain-containing protein n=1 Tax=Nocardia yamanashiensis TaxID=209247 RepID=UPI000830C2B1|nr:DUF11 domain-containing protein [Nocardia yamanashiensis]
MTSAPKPALKRAVMVASTFALAAAGLQFGTAPAYAVATPTTKYECKDVQTPGSLFPGDEVACTLTVSTTGNDSFTNVIAELTVPQSTTYQSGGNLQGKKVQFTLGEVTKTKSASATMTVMVDSKTAANTAISSEAEVKGFAPNGAFQSNASSNTLTTTLPVGGATGQLVAKQDTASVNTNGQAETPIADLVDAPAGVTPKIELVTSTEPKKDYVAFSIAADGKSISWSAKCIAATTETQAFTVKISANGLTPVESKVTVQIGNNVVNRGLLPTDPCVLKP